MKREDDVYPTKCENTPPKELVAPDADLDEEKKIEESLDK